MILQGDCLEQMKTLEKESVDMCMTSPPYWALRDYGTASWEGGEKDCDHITGRSKRTITSKSKKQTTMKGSWANETKGQCPSCGAKRIDKQLGLEQTFEEYINKLCDVFDEVHRVLKKEGTCWVNIGDTYSTSPVGNFNGGGEQFKRRNTEGIESSGKMDKSKSGVPSKSLIMIPMRFAIEMVNRGWILRNTIIWHKPNCMPSSAKDRFTADFEYLFFFSKQKKYYFEQQFEPMVQGTLKRYKYGWDGNKDRDFPNGLQNNLDSHFGTKRALKQVEKGRNKRTVWKICPKPFKEAHFAVYPEELCETPIKAGCPIGGTVLDPFFGAGTTGLVALKQGKKYIGCELNPEYIRIAKARIGGQRISQEQLNE